MKPTKSFYIETVSLSTGETIEVYRTEGGGVFGIDSSFLEQVKDAPGDTVIEPINGSQTILIDNEEVASI